MMVYPLGRFVYVRLCFMQAVSTVYVRLRFMQAVSTVYVRLQFMQAVVLPHNFP